MLELRMAAVPKGCTGKEEGRKKETVRTERPKLSYLKF